MVKKKHRLTMKKLKILAISYLFPNALQPNHGIFVLNRLKAMSKYADITVINPIPNSPLHKYVDKFSHFSKIPKFEQLQGIDIHHPRFLSIPGHLKSIEILTYRKAVQSIIKQIGDDFDLIDLHWTFPDLPTGSWLSNKIGCPFNVTLRGMEAFHLGDTGIRKYIVAHYLKKANRIISLSDEMAKKADELSDTGKKTHVIRNGVDTEKFYYQDKQECREKLNLPPNEKVILGIGGLIFRKGFDVVINALPQVISNEHLKNTKFYIVGSQGLEGDCRVQINNIIQKYFLHDKVVFVGSVANSELVTWYNAADVFCLSSRGEGSPNVLTEALACGTPAVATNVGSVPEIMASEPGLGDIIKSGDIKEMSDGLINVLSKPHDNKLQAKLFKKYNWDWCAGEVMKIIHNKEG
ncbi:glycosyltransferase [Colwellia sp. BRX10-6]|nr:glycosyltransferase [Colwellia sp. BRX10-9]MBA6393504.1 glycosyltransferase [Colwellia sp. BRX10-6]